MTYQVCYWDEQAKQQKVRDATPAEAAEIDARKTAPPPVPESLSPRQFRQALNHFGYRAAVDAGIAAADQDTKDWYAFATSFERHHPRMLAMIAQLGYSATQADELWTYGASL